MEPFLKWAGGKRWLTSSNQDIFPTADEMDRYIEPFLGGGAVFFHLEPTSGLISDINPDLINAYTVIRDHWADLTELLTGYHALHSEKFYYEMRDKKPRLPLQKAARFIYLNRTCWNGLYRVNKKGEFNVPIGTKTNVLLENDNFEGISKLLSNMEIESFDFETTIARAQEGDFIFVDPPYTVKHNLNGFVKYNEKIFSWEDQVRLQRCIAEAVGRGCIVLILNADHNSIRTLYNDIGRMTTMSRASVIAGDASARGVYTELAIQCW